MTASINHPSTGTMYAGAEAVNLFRVKTIAMANKMFTKSDMCLTRGMTKTKSLAMAAEYTGKKYKRGQHQEAYDDLMAYYAEHAAPITTREE